MKKVELESIQKLKKIKDNPFLTIEEEREEEEEEENVTETYRLHTEIKDY